MLKIAIEIQTGQKETELHWYEASSVLSAYQKAITYCAVNDIQYPKSFKLVEIQGLEL